MNKLIYVLMSFVFVFPVFSIEFEKMNLVGYNKEILSEKQIRFVKKDNPKKVVHLQVNSFEPKALWKEESLKKDVEEMFQTRKEMYKVFGFSDVNFYDYKLSKLGVLPKLDIFGSYKKINNKKVYFSESNIYFQKNFLQVKVINEFPDDKGKIPEKEVSEILAEIKAESLEIK